MNMIEAVRVCFQKYVTVSGRARRAEYWWWILFTLIVGLIFDIADGIIFQRPQDAMQSGPLGMVFTLVTFLPGFCVMIRRLHDVDRSGYWWMIGITIVGLIPLFYWLIIKGTSGDNRFGSDPLAPQMVG